MTPIIFWVIVVGYVAVATIAMGLLDSGDDEPLNPLWAALWPLTLAFFIIFAIVSGLYKLGEWIGGLLK